MLHVHKFPIPLATEFTFDFPVDHQIIKVGMQSGEPMMWTLVDTDDTTVKTYRFIVVGTGQPLYKKREDVEYIGTFLTRNDSLVFHVFEILK